MTKVSEKHDNANMLSASGLNVDIDVSKFTSKGCHNCGHRYWNGKSCNSPTSCSIGSQWIDINVVLSIDEKIQKLTNNFLYIEYYTHSSNIMYKIDCEYTKFAKQKLVLCPVTEGFEKALDLAINQIVVEQNNFLKGE